MDSPREDAAPESAADCVSPSGPDLVTAEEHHHHLVKTFRIENRSRLEFIETLLSFHEQRLHRLMGYSSVEQYCESQFRLKRTLVFELLRVARRLRELPLLRVAFGGGEVSWSAVCDVTRVANTETESRWLDFIRAHSPGRIAAEAAQALRDGRDRPRKRGESGLSRVETTFSVRLVPEERRELEASLEKVAAEMARRLGVDRVDLKDALLHMAHAFLWTDPDDEGEGSGLPPGRRPSREAACAVVYHQCVDCRRSSVLTAEGPEEVPPEVVDRVAPDAERVTMTPDEAVEVAMSDAAIGDEHRDRPNPPSLTRRVLLRDGGRCANPGCGRRACQAHHIVFRSRGGATALRNEISLCGGCHGLLHRGFLRIEASAAGEVRFIPCIAGVKRRSIEDDLARLASLGVAPWPLRAPATPTPAPAPPERSGCPDVPRSGCPDVEVAVRLRELAGGLKTALGFSAAEAFSRLSSAWGVLSEDLGRPPAEDELVREVFRSRRR